MASNADSEDRTTSLQQQPRSALPRYTHDDYSIGVICALPVEKAAFVAMLDEVHEILPTPKNDENSYTFGRIGDHNIITSCLPAGMKGNNLAATVAKDMLRSFPIRIGLMVGVGGGVWSRKVDIRLGDVVVSQPEGIHGGVVQWDFGKMESHGFKRIGSLNKPPRPLLNAVQDIKIKHMTEGNRLSEHLSKMAQDKPEMVPLFTYQGTEHDHLYEVTYNHAGGETCEGCDIQQTVKRQPRITLDPLIHYGNIASGNEVIKDSQFRDRVAQEQSVMCFEMEAAGLMDSFPCLVIRGICDYADSHKNKRWQPYAAATAAAYAKELLGVVKKQGLDELEPAKVSPYQTDFSLEGVPRVRKFIKRPIEIARLEQVLLHKDKLNQRQQIHILHGLGGIGKTQLAVEFMRQHHRQFSAVFWLDGRSADSVKRSIASCARRIPQGHISETCRAYATDGGTDNIDLIVREVMNWLARPDNRAWLLIFDNVDREYSEQGDDPDAFNIEHYLSGADHGSVLITTRLAKLEQLGESQPLGKVDNAQARAILESWYKKKHDTNESGHLLDLLDGLPLAIAQAGAYLQESGLEIKAYLRFYEQQWSELMKSRDINDAPLQDYPDRSVWTTWAISYQAIYKKHKPTANLLLLWSFLDNKDLWHGLFIAACEASETVTAMLSKWVGDIANSEIRFSQAMRLLRSYSLVESVEVTTSYATHPVVHRWAYHYQGKHFASELGQLALVTVGLAVPDRYSRDYPVLQRRLFPHAQICSRWAMQSQGSQGDNTNAEGTRQQLTVFDAMHRLGNLYDEQGKIAEAEEMYERVLQGKEEALSPNHTSTLNTVNNLGWLYVNQGKLAEAEKMLERALQGKEEALGPNHTSTLNTVNNLGWLYRDQGKLAEAEKMYERALQGKEEALGPNHTSTLNTVNNLGWLYRDQGKLAEAEKMLERALQGKEEALGPNHTSTLSTVNNLGGLYMDQGKLAEAEKMLERALQGYEDALGPNHTSTLNTVNNLGWLYRDQGKLAEAEKMLERALQGKEEALGPNHTSTLNTVSNLGGLHMDQGKLAEVEKMYKRALQGYEEALGSCNIEKYMPALNTLENIGNLYRRQEKYMQAQAMYSRALPGLQDLLGQSSNRCTKLVSTMRTLREIYIAQED
ncbi:hypothetical protein GQ44DRAFT_657694 [Phaeosphaeriaceae sp. PMI808]|nr:hypothetical protein GQ44DRAFT_657694 [Phaeosphaeriaceae sp. PMI808]